MNAARKHYLQNYRGTLAKPGTIWYNMVKDAAAIPAARNNIGNGQDERHVNGGMDCEALH